MPKNTPYPNETTEQFRKRATKKSGKLSRKGNPFKNVLATTKNK